MAFESVRRFLSDVYNGKSDFIVPMPGVDFSHGARQQVSSAPSAADVAKARASIQQEEQLEVWGDASFLGRGVPRGVNTGQVSRDLPVRPELVRKFY